MTEGANQPGNQGAKKDVNATAATIDTTLIKGASVLGGLGALGGGMKLPMPTMDLATFIDDNLGLGRKEKD